MTDANDVLGVIVAGGQGRRMGGLDKSFIDLAGRPLLQWSIDRFGSQVSRLIISANGDTSRFDEFGVPVVVDRVSDFAGPLAGLLAAMEWAQTYAPDIRWMASVSVDTPFLPRNLVAKFGATQRNETSDLVCAWSNGQIHPVCGLWRVDLAEDLRRSLLVEDLHKVDAWAGRHRMATLAFPADPVDPFFNINRPEDLVRAEALLASHSGMLA